MFFCLQGFLLSLLTGCIHHVSLLELFCAYQCIFCLTNKKKNLVDAVY